MKRFSRSLLIILLLLATNATAGVVAKVSADVAASATAGIVANASAGAVAGATPDAAAGAAGIKPLLSSEGSSMEKGIRLKICATKPFGVLYLLESLRGEPHHTEHLRELFYRARGRNADDERLLKDYCDAFGGKWETVRLPGDGGRERSIRDVLEIVAVSCENMDELLSRSREFLDTESYEKLRRSLLHFEPLYEEIIWSKCEKSITGQRISLEVRAGEIDFRGKLAAIARIYGSSLPEDLEILIAITPVPKEKDEHFSVFAHSNGCLEVVEMPQGIEPGRALGIAFHEMCHFFWDLRSDETKKPLKDWFIEAKGSPAYRMVNEGLATALGNGWVGSLIEKRAKDDQWYDDPYIDGYAKSLLPLAKEYIRDLRPLDRDFAFNAAQIFKNRFPDADRDPNLILREITVFSNEKDLSREDFYFKFARMRYIRSLHVESSLSAKETIGKFNSLSDASIIFLVKPEELESLKGYPFEASELDKISRLCGKALPCLWWKRSGSNWVFICVGCSQDEQLDALGQILKMERIPDSPGE